MPAVPLPKGSILSLGLASTGPWNRLTEHNRAALQVDTERIEKSSRMANGTMRKWFIADKITLTTSWDMVPHDSTFTVDGYWGGSDIEAFYRANTGDFWAQVRLPDGSTKEYRVVFKNFDKSVQKRGRYEFWNISLALEEV